ncbi:HAD hydrolase, IA, variant 1 family protein [Lyngbya aestuarii BL J]|mgnify:CR=1 FL=1|uniref:HAD hydrolase, IA, variant 1 family protein n=1 Tax=Lyngbya aestuarii BL J TaxID=1348334 RepID=U7QA55_9CYAN|nr:HAD-IA family hydrolase [Lyngbya aestuarii]ERT04724.1 HAD hydrolase, IA, variant 1 family protein [Lyngbya aestuarii BL J]
MKNILIFDFDGTLADTLDAIAQISNRLSVEFGYPPTSPEDLAELKNLSAWEIIRRSKISIFKLPFLLRRIRRELQKDIQYIHLFPEIKEVLEELKNQGYSLYILTSNSRENVIEVFQKYQILHLFDRVDSASTLFGKSRYIKNILKQENLLPSKALYIGDETRDIEAAKKAKVKTIAVSWGFNSPEILSRYHPDALIDHPQELIKVLQAMKIQE